MSNDLPYDINNPRSIESYAKLLVDKTLKQVLGDSIKQTYSGKGKLGQILEDLYFKYKPNSNSEPDFKEAGVELKTSPIKKIGRGWSSKERLVLNIINYKEEYKQTFSTSSFWKKNQLILLMFYLFEQDKIDLDYIFKIIRLWQFPSTDLKIIKDDWEKIVTKIKEGKAHEISEGDTLYLGACTKGANNKSLRQQPFSEVLAMQRAFSIKSKYLNFIIESSLSNKAIKIDYDEYEKILNDNNELNESRARYIRLNLDDLEPIVKSIHDYSKGETFEALVLNKFIRFYGYTDEQLLIEFNLKSTTAKNKYHLISKAILGIQKGKIEEFEKAGVIMKTIRLESSGALKESMSFAQIQFKEIINELWEDSYWYETLTKRFFFVIYQKDKKGNLRLKKAMFWTMPLNDLSIAKLFWEDTKNKIINDQYDRFIKISDDQICHVRPKGIDSSDLMETPSGRMEKKKCYWLNSSYIKQIIQ